MREDIDRRTRIRGYSAVRDAARDYATFSSDLQGESDVRNYRQLPLEADPPRHTMFRAALQPLFMASSLEPKRERFENLAAELISGLQERGGGDIVQELALPYVVGCLSIIYDRPQDYEEWLSWGSDVFDIGGHHSAATVDAYITRVFDEAEARRRRERDTFDIWDAVSQLSIDGRNLTREEMHGIASVLLAGGRDTVIKLLSGIAWHLIRSEADRRFLQQNPDAYNRAIAEMARYLSPLPEIERVVAAGPAANSAPAEAGDRVLLSFVSANYDRSVWTEPERVDIHRERRPHLAFGFARHSCLGMNVTEYESRAFLGALLTHWPCWVFDGEPDIVWLEDTDGEEPFRAIRRFASIRVSAGGGERAHPADNGSPSS